jgi:hypothetical protein
MSIESWLGLPDHTANTRRFVGKTIDVADFDKSLSDFDKDMSDFDKVLGASCDSLKEVSRERGEETCLSPRKRRRIGFFMPRPLNLRNLRENRGGASTVEPSHTRMVWAQSVTGWYEEPLGGSSLR